MQLIDGSSSTVGQIDSAFVEEGQRVVGSLGMDLTGVTLQCCDAGCSGGVDAVVLASSTAGELPYGGGGGGRDVEDDFTERE